MTKSRRRQAGEGTICAYRLASGHVQYLIKYSHTKPDGSRGVVLKRGYLTKKEAAADLRKRLSSVDDHTHVVPAKMTTGEWLEQWLDGLQLAPSTMASYRKNVRLHLKPRLGSTPLQQLTGAWISTAYRGMETDGRQDHKAGEGLSKRTVRYCHTILKAALSDAVRQGLVVKNAAGDAKPPSVTAAKAPEMHPWSGTELGTFLRWAQEKASEHAPGWHVLGYTGMRRGELLALRWRDLDVDHAALSVRRSVGIVRVEGQGKQMVEGPTKGKRARVIDLDKDTLEVLRAWRLARAGISLSLVRDDAMIFGALDGKHQHPERFSARFVEKQAQCRRALKDSAPPAIRLHDLRHTHATLLLKAGVPVKVVSERLGHASVMITLETYAHVMPGMQAEAAATFAALMSGGA